MIPSIDRARKTLARAKREFDALLSEMEKGGKKQSIDQEGQRQVAEKAWRASREAVYSVMCSRQKNPGRRTLPSNSVSDFETKVLKRTDLRLARGYAKAITELHGECFYDGTCPDPGTMRSQLDEVEKLIDLAEDDVQKRPR